MNDQPRRTLGKIVAIIALIAVTTGCTVTIPAIGLHEFVIFGGQRELDQGHVVIPQWGGISDGHGGTYSNGCLPRQGCPVWLAGHRTTHGSVFNRIPELEPGDLIHIDVGDETTTYEVTHIRIVPRLFPASGMVGDLIIQTSWPNDQRFMVFGKEIAVTDVEAL